MDERGHIYLVGFMGSGKSTVGPLLAQRLGRLFLDLDQRIVEQQGRSIAEIFRSRGESGFRLMEHQALRETAADPPMVVALGGGAFTRPENRRLARSLGVSVWLEASLETVERRAAREPGRPLAQEPGEFQRLFLRRQSDYRKADLRVDADSLSPPQVAEAIANLLAKR